MEAVRAYIRSLQNELSSAAQPKVKYSQWDPSDLEDSYSDREPDFSAIGRAMESGASPKEIFGRLALQAQSPFVERMLKIIREKDLTGRQVYTAAGMDRRLYSKIISNRDYKPQKDTCIAIALALKLSLPEARDLLSKAGYAFSHSSVRDIVIEYYFASGEHDLQKVNNMLYAMKLPVIGS